MQEARRSLKARLSAGLGKEPASCPVELSAASLPIHGALRPQDLAELNARLPSMPLPDDLDSASLIGTAVGPLCTLAAMPMSWWITCTLLTVRLTPARHCTALPAGML